MMLPVFIPSRGRANMKLIQAGAFAQLPKGYHVAYVVPDDEYDAYAKLGVPLIRRPPEVQGIAAARRFIGYCAQQFSLDKFIVLDDDLKFSVRISLDDWHLRKATSEDLVELLGVVSQQLDDYGHVGVGARQGNNNLGPGDKPLIVENTRTMRALAYRTAEFMAVEHCRVTFMEDFDVNLQLLRKGVPNCTVNFWVTDQSMTNAPGGCSVYRTHQLHEEAAHKLAELHPGFVSLRQKVNKTGGEFGTRTEVTIQWKKAYESSRR